MILMTGCVIGFLSDKYDFCEEIHNKSSFAGEGWSFISQMMKIVSEYMKAQLILQSVKE